MTSPVPGWVVLRGVRCSITQPEATEPTLLLIDLRVHADLAPAARSDALADAVDIAALADTIREIAAARPRALLETLGVDLGHALLQRFTALDAIELRIGRADPPGLDAAEEAVELTLERR
jgi:7,8-dihydroneopterin aldolase/epimerase/oxygenase